MGDIDCTEKRIVTGSLSLRNSICKNRLNLVYTANINPENNSEYLLWEKNTNLNSCRIFTHTHTHTHIYIYIYIYIKNELFRPSHDANL